MCKLVYIIILNWNGLNDTIEAVKSCLKLEYHLFEIVIVDNNSDDGSELILKKQFPWLVILQTGNNIGYAGGNNLGIRYALEMKADYIWLLNNDTVVDPMALIELVNILEIDPSIGMAGSKILSFTEPSLLSYAGGWVDVDLGTSVHIGYGQIDNHQFDDVVETEYITGCSLLVRRSVIDKIGFMDEGYFLYFEESEWCIKAKRHKFRLVYVPSSVIYHKESVSTQKVKGSLTYYMTRNRLYFISKNGTKAKWLKRFRIDLFNLLKCTCKKDFLQVRSMWIAYWHWFTGYRGRYDCLYKRKSS